MDKTSVMVEFSILGDDFNPEEITSRLSIKPTEQYLKGSKSRKNFERKESCWCISTGYVETLYVSELLDMLIGKLIDKKDIIQKLKKEWNLECKFFVVINIENNVKPAVYIEKEVIEFANAVGAEFDFDLYIF